MAGQVLGPAWTSNAGQLIDAGRFPLGVETATLTNARRLVPLVNTGTTHARYYLLHAAIAATTPVSPGDRAALDQVRDRIRRAEVVQGLASLRHATEDPTGHQTGIPFSEPHAARILAPALHDGDVDLANLARTYSRVPSGFFAGYRGAEIEAGLLDPRNGSVLPGPLRIPLTQLTGVAEVLTLADRSRVSGRELDTSLPAACLCQVRHGTEFHLLDQLLLDADRDTGARGVPRGIREARRRTALSANLLLHALDGQERTASPAGPLTDLCLTPGEELRARLGDELADWAQRWLGALLRNSSVTAWRWLWRWLTDRLVDRPRSRADLADALTDALLTGAGTDQPLGHLLARLPPHREGNRLLDAEGDLLHRDGIDNRDPWTCLQVLALSEHRLTDLHGHARSYYRVTADLSPDFIATWLSARSTRLLSHVAHDLTDLLLSQSERISQTRIRWEGGRLRIPTRLRQVGDILFLAGTEGSTVAGLRLERLRQLLEELGYLDLDSDTLTWGPAARHRWTA